MIKSISETEEMLSKSQPSALAASTDMMSRLNRIITTAQSLSPSKDSKPRSYVQCQEALKKLLLFIPETTKRSLSISNSPDGKQPKVPAVPKHKHDTSNFRALEEVTLLASHALLLMVISLFCKLILQLLLHSVNCTSLVMKSMK